MSAENLAAVWGAIKARATAQITLLPMFWPREPNKLPDKPSPFVFFDLTVDRTGPPVGFGGGRGRNLYRCEGELNGYLFVPRNFTVEAEARLSEHIAAAFRGFRNDVISCFGATPSPVGEGAQIAPPGFPSAAAQYDCTVVSIDLMFDQIG